MQWQMGYDGSTTPWTNCPPSAVTQKGKVQRKNDSFGRTTGRVQARYAGSLSPQDLGFYSVGLKPHLGPFDTAEILFSRLTDIAGDVGAFTVF